MIKTLQQHCKEIGILGRKARYSNMTKEKQEKINAHMKKMNEASKLARVRKKIAEESRKKVEEEAIKSMIE